MIVEIVNPKKDETILDPACGSAGFLVSAYRHILEENKDNEGRNTLTGDERKQLTENIAGYDISPDMVRLARVNLYLHQFTNPDISEYDTLTSEAKWEESFDVILANPPFMTPKGGIKPHNRYRVQAKRSEVLFVDYIAEHLNPKGRAGIIVPEGIVFKSENAYKKLRQFLVGDQYLYAVISLPAGVFNPYSNVKTSILFFDKSKTYDKVLFVKMSNDGFDVGAQRRPIEGSELEEITKIITDFQNNVDVSENPLVTLATREEMKALDFDLTAERYKKEDFVDSVFPLVPVKEVCELRLGGTPSKERVDFWTKGDIKWISSKYIDNYGKITNFDLISEEALSNSSTKIAPKNSTIVITRVSVGKTAFADDDYAINQDMTCLIPKENLHNKFLFLMSSNLAKAIEKSAQGIGVKGVTQKFLSDLKFPLPPLSVQEEIVAEIEGYQKIVDSAREILEHYKPTIKIDPSWERVTLGSVCDVRDGTHDSPKATLKGFPLVTSKNLKDGFVDLNNVTLISSEDYESINKRSKVGVGDILMPMIGTIGNPVMVQTEPDYSIKNVALIKEKTDSNILNQYVCLVLKSELFNRYIETNKRGGTQKFISLTDIRSFEIPLPPLPVQEQIVAEIEEEMAIVKQNKKLMEIFQKKIQDRIVDVWGEET